MLRRATKAECGEGSCERLRNVTENSSLRYVTGLSRNKSVTELEPIQTEMNRNNNPTRTQIDPNKNRTGNRIGTERSTDMNLKPTEVVTQFNRNMSWLLSGM